MLSISLPSQAKGDNLHTNFSTWGTHAACAPWLHVYTLWNFENISNLLPHLPLSINFIVLCYHSLNNDGATGGA